MREIFVAAAAAALLAACGSPREELTRDELATSARELRQLAADAQLLATERARDHVTENFAWVHQKALGDASLKLAEEVAKPVPPSLRPDFDQWVALNARFGTEVRNIAGHPADDAVAAKFAALAAQARALEEKK